MPSGGLRANTGPIPKMNPDGTRVNPKRVKPAPGEPKRPRGRPPKINPDGTGAVPVRQAAPSMPAALQPGGDFSHMPFPDVGLDGQPLDVLLGVMRDKRMHPEIRIRAAQMALPFTAIKPGEAKPGKREQRLLDAAEVLKEGNKFAPGRPPLAVVNR